MPSSTVSGLATGGINPRATALIWKAGEGSLVEDVRIHGGHGTVLPNGQRVDYSGAPVPHGRPAPGHLGDRWRRRHLHRQLDAQHHGRFRFLRQRYQDARHVYELSAEHHNRHEIVLDGVENWEFLAPQTEQEVVDGLESTSLEIRNSKHILFANYHTYRVTRSLKPAPTAVKLFNVDDIRFRNLTTNAESGIATCDTKGCGTYERASKFPYDNAITDFTHKLEVREREFAVLDVSANPATPPAAPRPRSGNGQGRKAGRRFLFDLGCAADAKGNLYFVDHHFQRIYRWSQPRGLEIVSDAALDPVNLAVDTSGHLMVLSSDGIDGTVYSFDPWVPTPQITLIAATPAAPIRARSRPFRAMSGQWRVQGPTRSEDLYLHDPGPNVCSRHGGRQVEGVCLTRRQLGFCRPSASTIRARSISRAGGFRTRSTPLASSPPSRRSRHGQQWLRSAHL